MYTAEFAYMVGHKWTLITSTGDPYVKPFVQHAYLIRRVKKKLKMFDVCGFVFDVWTILRLISFLLINYCLKDTVVHKNVPLDIRS